MRHSARSGLVDELEVQEAGGTITRPAADLSRVICRRFGYLETPDDCTASEGVGSPLPDRAGLTASNSRESLPLPLNLYAGLNDLVIVDNTDAFTRVRQFDTRPGDLLILQN
jgi:hypothetical protein